MYVQVENPKENKSRMVADSVTQKKSREAQGFGFLDNRPQVKQVQLHTKADSNSAKQQNPIQKKYSTIGLKSTIDSFSYFSNTIQLLSTDSLAQPEQNHQSDVVPDLTTELVTQILQAKTKEHRNQVLQNLLVYLNGKGVVDDIDKTKIEYVHSNDTKYAVTQTISMDDDGDIGITVYKNCFEDGPAVLYSTLRHELIHVAQRLAVTDEDNAVFDDNYMYENIYDEEVGVQTRNCLQIPLQEIETHCWELVHADETCISDKYKSITADFLIGYVDTLINTVIRIDINIFIYWHDYLSKAVILLTEALDSYDDGRIKTKANQLATLVFQRQDKAME